MNSLQIDTGPGAQPACARTPPAQRNAIVFTCPSPKHRRRAGHVVAHRHARLAAHALPRDRKILVGRGILSCSLCVAVTWPTGRTTMFEIIYVTADPSPCLTSVAVSPCCVRTDFWISHYIVVSSPSGDTG